MNLAVVLAQAGHAVALISADFRHPVADELLGLAHSAGLAEVLMGTAELTSAIQQPIANLRVLRSGEMPPKPSELLGSLAMKRLMESLRESAEFIIIDTPPVLGVADAASTARWADGALVVVRVRLTTRDDAREVREQLDGVGARVVGVVVTGLKDTAAGRGGQYTYAGRGAQ